MPEFRDVPEPDPKKLTNGNGKHPGRNLKQDLEAVKKNHEKAMEGATGKLPPRIVEPRCHTCQSDYRDYIEREIIRGHSYLAIAKSIPDGPDRRSISKHHKEHMAITAAAYRAILEEEASLEGQNYDEGVRGAITNRGVLELMIRKGFDDVIDNNTMVEPKDLIQIIKLKSEKDANHAQIQVETYKRQVDLFKQAILEVVPPDMQARIVAKVKKLRQLEEDVFAHEKLLAAKTVESSAVDITDEPS
jgi:hypothetical protein